MTQATAEILSQGEELVTGEIADTNAAWLSSELIGLGFDVTRHTAVGDRLEALIDLLREISRRADLCLCTGGLGPTCDDLTAEAVSLAFERPLAMDPTALTQIEDWFSRMNRDMPSVNRKQAMLPAGATRLDNLWGTAPGFSITAGRCRFFFMPGVPSEMKAMYQTAIRPELRRLYALAPPHRVVLRTLGLGESTLQELLNPIPLPDGTSLGFRAGGAENQVKLTFPPSLPEAAIDDTLDAVKQALGDAIYAITRNGKGPQSLIDVIGQGMAAKNA
jgi:nicotinamide-nucleotide amidase